MKFIPLKCTFQCFLVYSQDCGPITLSNSRPFPLTQKKPQTYLPSLPLPLPTSAGQQLLEEDLFEFGERFFRTVSAVADTQC